MTKIKQVFLIITCFIYCLKSSAQVKFSSRHFADLLSRGEYTTLWKEGLALRAKSFGKDEEVCWYMGKALCGNGNVKSAMTWYSNIINNYKLSPAKKNLITTSMTSCSDESKAKASGAPVRLDPNLLAILSKEQPGSKISGSVDNLDIALGIMDDGLPDKIEQVTEISDDDLDARLFYLDEGQAAKAYYENMLGSGYNILTEGSFIFITPAGNDNENENESLKAEINNLEKIYAFYIKFYDITPPDMFITVYLLPKEDDGNGRLAEAAEKVHGVKIPGNYEGYEYFDDLSLLGIDYEENVNYKGILAHELWHIVVRSEIGDVSPWMDEGIACMYQNSQLDEEGMLTGKGGSFHELDYPLHNGTIPHLKEFLGYSWSKFMGYDDGSKLLADYNYAYSEYLMLYLQSQNKLQDAFNAVANEADLSDMDNITIKTDVEVFEELFGKDITTIDKEFDAWMVETQGFSIY